MKIKILHILWSGHRGGVERYVYDITTYSDKEKFEHSVCFLSEGGIYANQMDENGVSVYYLGMTSGLSLAASMRFFSVINKIKPDIITNHTRNYLIALFLTFYQNIKKVHFEHGGVMDGNITKRTRKIYKCFFNCFVRFYPLILSNTNYLKDKIVAMVKINPARIELYDYGVDLEKYNRVEDPAKRKAIKTKLGIPGNHKVIGMVGRLAQQKGVDEFITIASLVQEKVKECSYIIVGDGPLRNSLEKKAKECCVAIKFLGDQPDVPKLLSIFDIYLFTSRWEPFGIVIVEALASKIPVVGYEVPGMKEIITKGGGGILLREREPHKVAETILKLLANPEEYYKLSKEGYENARKNYEIHHCIQILENKYSTLFQKP